MKKQIKKIIDDNNSFLILAHVNPDGDAIGSTLAFFNYLNSINKTVIVIMDDGINKFSWLNGFEMINNNLLDSYDVGIVVDCSSKERIADINRNVDKCNKLIVIDHHISNTLYGDINYVEGNISSCCQVIYDLFKEWNIPISKEIAECLFTGVLTDTNGFSINNVDGDTFRLVAEISDVGINISDIFHKVWLSKSLNQHKLFLLACDRLEFYHDNKIAFTYTTDDDFVSTKTVYGDHEGIVEIGRNIDSVEVSIYIRLSNNEWIVSLRSSGYVDVSKIAIKLGGGGHKMAAGCTMYGTLDEVKKMLIGEIESNL